MTTFSSDQLNFFKFSTVVIDEFTDALRKVFEDLWNNQTPPPPGFQLWDDSAKVRNLFLNQERGRKKLNVPTSKSFMEWDCTALFDATLYAQSFAVPDGTGGLAPLGKVYLKPGGLSPGTFHHSVISPFGDQAETFALALDQLRLLRNSLCHQTSTQKIDKATFDNYIQLSKDAIGALGQSTTKIDDVGKLGEKDFPTSRVQQLEEELRRERFKQIEDNQAQMDAKITNLGSDMKDLISTANVLNSGVADVKRSLQVAESDANAVKSGITDIDTKLENVKSDLKDVKTKVISVTTKVAGVTLDVNFVKNEVTTFNPKVEEMRSDLRGMKPRVKSIETRTKDVGLDVKDIRTRVTDIKTKTEDIEALGKEIKIGMADATAKVQDVGSNVKGLSTGVTAVKTKVKETRSEVKEVKNEITGMKTKVEDIGSDVKGVQSGVTDVRSKVANLGSGMKDMQRDVTEVKTQLKSANESVKSRVAEIERNVIKDIRSYVKPVKGEVTDLKTDVQEIRSDTKM